MKKLLVIAILMLALVFTVVACNNEPVVDETTVADTTAENPTEAPTAEPTAEPTEEATKASDSETPTSEPSTDSETQPEQGGCKSSITMGFVVMLAFTAAVVLKKRKED